MVFKNLNQSQQYLEILKTNQRSITIMYHKWVENSLKYFSRHSALYFKIKKCTCYQNGQKTA